MPRKSFCSFSGFSTLHHPSLIRQALFWCAVTLAAFSLIGAAGSFYVGYKNARIGQDRVLKEVVGMLSRDVVHERYKNRLEELTVGGWYGPGSRLGESIEASDAGAAALTMDDAVFEDRFEQDDDDSEAVVKAGETVLVRTLENRGKAVSVVLKKDYRDGAHTLELFGDTYRVYFRTLADGTHVAAGQLLSARNRALLQSALTAAAPFLIGAPVVLLVLLWVLWRTLWPLQRISSNVERRDAKDLTAISTDDLPKEVEPLVAALNGLLARVSDVLKSEQKFVADAAHELRSPMTALSLQVDRLAESDLPPEAKKRVLELRAAVQRANALVTQLLALKRAQAERAHTTDVPKADCRETVAAVVGEVYWAADEKNIALSVEGLEEDEASPAVRMDPKDLTSLLRNLVGNAVKYTPEGGSVTVRVAEEANAVRLTVVDTGPGIPENERDRVFDPFYRILGTKEQGTGLGLAICRTLVDRWHAELTLDWADPEARSGLKAEVRVPKA